MDRRNALRMLAAGLAANTGGLRAQERSGTPLKIIVPFPAGGLHDLMTRQLAQSMAKTLHRPVVVDNRAGAAGLVGLRAFQAASAEGGPTLLMTFTGFVALPFSQKGANYDPARDFAPVAAFGNAPAFLIVNGSVPAKTVPELIAHARSVPSGLEAATSGPGGWSDIWTQMLARRANIPLLRVPYKGSSEMAVALLSGEAKLILSAFNEAFHAQVQAGKLRVLAVTSSQPSPLLPGVPTLASTLPGFVVDGWFGLHAALNMPREEVAVISQAVKAALAEPATREKFTSLYVDPMYQDPREFARSIAATTEQWRKVASELNLVPQ
jgi:tripartite-type tricarboxylate transporter receptor subunit TctC